MRKLAILLVLFAFAAAALGQSAPLERQADGETVSSVAYLPDAQVESWARISSASPSSAPALEGSCAPNSTTLCLLGGRYQVRIIFSAPNLGIFNSPAQVVVLTSDTGYAWFFSANNVEIVIKVVDGSAFNGFVWVFFGALSNVQYTITVTDTVTEAVKVYTNAAGTLASVADTAAFPAGPSCTYTVGPASPSSFGSGGGTGTVNVTTAAGCAWSAVSNSGFVTITNPGPGSGSGTVNFSVASNMSSSSRSGTMTVAGQPVTINQSGVSSGGTYDGTWNGTNSLTCDPASGPPGPCPVGWTIANNAFTRFNFGAAGPCGIVDSGTTINYSTPLPISGNSFTISSSGSPPVRISFTVNGTFNSSSSASGSGTVTFTTSSPLPSCTATVPVTFSATKS